MTANAAPGPGSNIVVTTPEALRLTKWAKALDDKIAAVKADNDRGNSEAKAAAQFFGHVRALSQMIDLLVDQPGFQDVAGSPGVKKTAAANSIITSMKTLKTKMASVQTKIAGAVNVANPVPTTGPKWFASHIGLLQDLKNFLLDPNCFKDGNDLQKDMETVKDDKTIPDSWKAWFFNEQLGASIANGIHLVIQRDETAKEISDAVNDAINNRNKNSLIGMAFVVSQAAASAAGNLPGPSTIYVGYVRAKALKALDTMARQNVTTAFDWQDLESDWFRAMNFADEDKAFLTPSLNSFRQKLAAAAGKGPNTSEQAEADALWKTIVARVDKGNQAHAGGAISIGMTILNIGMLLGSLVVAWPPQGGLLDNWQLALNTTVSLGTTVTSACATAVRLGNDWALVKFLGTNAGVGKALGIVGGVVSIVEGGAILITQLRAKDRDGWQIAVGTLQLASGLIIVAGVLCASPGTQIIGVVVGIAAGIVGLLNDAAMAPMLHQMVKNVVDSKSPFSQDSIAKTLGIDSMLTELDALVDSTKVTELGWEEWTGVPSPTIAGKNALFDRLNVELGIKLEDCAKLVAKS